ncbi:MAG: acyl-CoA dehydrogenase N-terminal domain-containing protein, partial [Pseudomonadota bacterium]
MPTYQAPVRDMQFLFQDVLELEQFSDLEGFRDATPDVMNAILEEGAKLTQEVLFPLNQVGDQQGCNRRQDGGVETPDGFKGAYDTYCEGRADWGAIRAVKDAVRIPVVA